MSQPSPTTASQPRIGRFVLMRKIGNGGQGTVYLAEDPVLDRRVAIKLLPDDDGDGTGSASIAVRSGAAHAPPADVQDTRACDADHAHLQSVSGAHLRTVSGAHLRDVAVFADAVCEILGGGESAVPGDDFAALCARFEHSLDLDSDMLPRIAAGALDRFDDHAGILGINTRASAWYRAARTYVQAAKAPATAQHPSLTPLETLRSD